MQKQNSVEQNTRSPFIDQIRGLAVLLMVFFHLSYDLSVFQFINIDTHQDPFWFSLPRIIVFLFLICVGVGLRLSHLTQIHWKKFWVRFFKIGVLAILFSVATYFTFPDKWIYFGTLHCIALCSLCALPFLKRPKLALALGLLILGADFSGFRIPWIKLSHASMDYIPLFPWISFTLIGIFLHSVGFHRYQLPINLKLLEFCGKHALSIYILHQPILYGSIYLIYQVSN